MGINEWMNNGGIRGKMAAGKHTVSDWLTDRPHGSYGRCPSPYLSPLTTVSSLGSCCCLCCCCAWLRVKFARGLGPQQSQSCFLINFHRKKEKKEKQAEKWQCWDDFLNLGLRRARLLWGWGCTLYTDRHTYVLIHMQIKSFMSTASAPSQQRHQPLPVSIFSWVFSVLASCMSVMWMILKINYFVHKNTFQNI